MRVPAAKGIDIDANGPSHYWAQLMEELRVLASASTPTARAILGLN